MIVGGGCRGRQLAAAMVGEGHAVRISTRSHEGRGAIETVGAECWVGTPDRLATLRGALENVSIVCWLLATATGSEQSLRELHTSRLQLFLTQTIDTTVRGFVYEACAAGMPPAPLAEGEAIARTLVARNAIPARFLTADPLDVESWLVQASEEIHSLFARA